MCLPHLPSELSEFLQSPAFEADAIREFDKLDWNKTGVLEHPDDLIPVIVELSTGRAQSMDDTQVTRFFELFDNHEDGKICRDEFVNLVQFVIVNVFLETEDDKLANSMKLSPEAIMDSPGAVGRLPPPLSWQLPTGSLGSAAGMKKAVTDANAQLKSMGHSVDKKEDAKDEEEKDVGGVAKGESRFFRGRLTKALVFASGFEEDSDACNAI
eukprot:gnl/TRDRNA2_/TRDRNA2_34190_c0_seq1.p1 gnl/TRDRNA2_/TRDRNA2_34190_c0~~gnl/TRDRNA2_/TRDRNA2_34190_c0_seq1.p1  ORF type:complete len:245 (+),score=54.34 gnl/TRDRNA2_/TRDRNA2_34190_c0_seq1:102-737(+)